MNMSQTEAGKEGKLESSDELRRKRTLTPVQWSTLYKCKYKCKHNHNHKHNYKYKCKYKYKYKYKQTNTHPCPVVDTVQMQMQMQIQAKYKYKYKSENVYDKTQNWFSCRHSSDQFADTG